MGESKCEICGATEFCDRHHIHSLALGGKDSKGNQCRLCPNCHRRVHKGKIIIEGKFMTSGGLMPVWRNKEEKSITGLNDPLIWRY